MAQVLAGMPKAVSDMIASADLEIMPRLRRIEDSLRRARERVLRAEQALSRADEEESADAERELEEARDALRRIEYAEERVRDALGDYRHAARAILGVDFRRGREYLEERIAMAEAYAAIRPDGATASRARPPGETGSRAAAESPLPKALPALPHPYRWIPLDEIEVPREPLEWKKIDRETVVRGMTAFARDLAPMMVVGAAGDEALREFDAKHGRQGSGFVHPESLANLRDVFFGADSIAVGRKASGGYDVSSGRHRIEVARSLGWSHVPAFMTGGH